MLRERRFPCKSYEPGSPCRRRCRGRKVAAAGRRRVLGEPAKMKRSRSLEDPLDPPREGLASSLAFCRRRGR